MTGVVQMNSLTEMVHSYRPESFVSVDTDVLTLKTKLRLSPAGAYILMLLLREYQVHINKFNTEAARQQIYSVRNALRGKFGDDVIVSIGLGFYAVPDNVKKAIQEFLDGRVEPTGLAAKLAARRTGQPTN
jgi:hypothetical protein